MRNPPVCRVTNFAVRLTGQEPMLALHGQQNRGESEIRPCVRADESDAGV